MIIPDIQRFMVSTYKNKRPSLFTAIYLTFRDRYFLQSNTKNTVKIALMANNANNGKFSCPIN